MTPEQRLEKLEQQMLRLKARHLLQMAEHLLLQLEKTDPGLAAHVTTILDDPRQNFPVQWD